MGGGDIQLAIAGEKQDSILFGNPEITFFKVVYKRHTNFTLESINIEPDQQNGNTINFGKKISFSLLRNGDLVNKMYLQIKLNVKNSIDIKYIGYSLIKSVEIQIGGKGIDKHTGEWLHIWNELTTPIDNKPGVYQMTSDNLINSTKYDAGDYKLYIPLKFWFCSDFSQSLPLVALQFHEVKIIVELENELYDIHEDNKQEDIEILEIELITDYIYLDSTEREIFTRKPHEYIIQQLQYTGNEYIEVNQNNLPISSTHTIPIQMNHPVKELIWVLKDSDKTISNFKKLKNCQMFLNGHLRLSERNGKYFSHIQPYQHHTNIPDSNNPIHVYSFGLEPENKQPSGTCNMSRIDKAQLLIKTYPEDEVRVFSVYGVNYNVFRIISGMGGLVFSN